LGAAYVRFRGSCWGWPGVFDADAPHVVNLAVYFGSGDFNPHIFKYPTLWPYLLSAAYGAYYLAGLVSGAWHGVAQFGAQFVWHTANFHVVARLLTAALSLLAVWVVWRAAREAGGGGLWAAGIAAFTPVLAELAHTPKADTILFLFSALAWRAAMKLQDEKNWRNAALCGLWIGLALSSQYTAAALVFLPFCAVFTGRREGWSVALRLVLIAALCAFAAVLATSPYIFIAHNEFSASMADMSRELAIVREAHPRWQVARALAVNVLFYAGAGSLAFLAALAGFALVWRTSVSRFLLYLLPCLLHLLLLVNHPYGGWLRFLIPVLPAFIVLSGIGAEHIYSKKQVPAVAALLALLLIGPGLWRSCALAQDFALPDTRLRAAAWISKNLPSGAKLLLDQEHDSPQLPMAKEQAEALLERTRAAGHPKSKYYELMSQSHPGGGYKIYRIERSAADLESRPEHVRWSNSARDMVDVRSGLDALSRLGIDAVVLSSHGLDPVRRPEYAAFVGQLRAR